MINKLEIADYIYKVKLTYAGYGIGLIFLNDDSIYDLLLSRGYDKGSSLNLGRRDNTYYRGIDLYSSIELVRNNSDYNLTFLSSWFMVVISCLGDYLAKNDYFDKRPELEFFRHIRNAVSHGNKFHFLGDEPKRLAQFGGLSINRDLQGKVFLFDFMSTGDLFDLFDYIEKYLRE